MTNASYCFAVSNMKCEGCVESVTSVLEELGGVEDINVSLDEHKATLTSALPAEDIAKAISNAGFPATLT